MKTGTANLPLHPGKCPSRLFRRMKPMAGAIAEAIALEQGRDEFLRRISDPFWFQAFGCVLGFDWHSSGLTTTVCGALKEGLADRETGIAVCGGKGKTSVKTPQEIGNFGEDFSLRTADIERLVYSSRMSAKVDNTAVQDGYQLYHHMFIFTESGQWTVIQQGLNTENRYARRYHWLSDRLASFVNEPHKAICCDKEGGETLNMVSGESKDARKVSVDLVREGMERFLGPNTLERFFRKQPQEKLNMPGNHLILNMNKRNMETLRKAHEIQPDNYEELLSVRGMGPKTVRALALVSELVYGTKADWKDPVKFSFAHGGKDGIPYPVDRETYDRSIGILKQGIEEAKLGRKEKMRAVRRLGKFL